MSSVAWLLSAGFGVLMLLGVPFAFAIGIVVAISLLVAGIEPLLMPQSILSPSTNSCAWIWYHH